MARINITVTLDSIQDALSEAYPDLAWEVRGIDNEWTEIELVGQVVVNEQGRRSAEPGGQWPQGLDLAAFVAGVQERQQTPVPTVAERLAAIELASLDPTPAGKLAIARNMYQSGVLTDQMLDSLVSRGILTQQQANAIRKKN